MDNARRLLTTVTGIICVCIICLYYKLPIYRDYIWYDNADSTIIRTIKRSDLHSCTPPHAYIRCAFRVLYEEKWSCNNNKIKKTSGHELSVNNPDKFVIVSNLSSLLSYQWRQSCRSDNSRFFVSAKILNIPLVHRTFEHIQNVCGGQNSTFPMYCTYWYT